MSGLLVNFWTFDITLAASTALLHLHIRPLIVRAVIVYLGLEVIPLGEQVAKTGAAESA